MIARDQAGGEGRGIMVSNGNFPSAGFREPVADEPALAQLVQELHGGIRAVARGDLTHRLPGGAGRAEPVRDDFNAALTLLNDTVADLLEAAFAIHGEALQLARAAEAAPRAAARPAPDAQAPRGESAPLLLHPPLSPAPSGAAATARSIARHAEFLIQRTAHFRVSLAEPAPACLPVFTSRRAVAPAPQGWEDF
jgi:hypothetical protein